MSFSILRVAKVKSKSDTTGIQKHNQRENKNYQNPDIDHYRTKSNYDLINDENINYQQAIDKRIEEGYMGKRKIRSDAVLHVDGIITSDSEFFENIHPIRRKDFFKDSLEFLEKEYGKENMIYATVHQDEKTPHMHFGFVPLMEDGRLSAKEKVGNKKALTDVQDRFNVFLKNKGYDLERGVSKEITQAEHKEMSKFKKDTVYHKEQFDKFSRKRAGMQAEYDQLIEDYSESLEMLNKDSEFDYEDEKYQQKNIFGKVTEETKTGRKIINAEDFEKIEKRFKTASQMMNVYEEMTNTDFVQENQKLQKDKDSLKGFVKTWRDGYHEKNNEVEELKRENKQLKENYDALDRNMSRWMQNTAGVYKALRSRFEGFEEAYDDFSAFLSKNELTEHLGAFMDEIKQNVHTFDKEKQKKREKSKGFDLEL